MILCGLEKFSMVDYPGKVACTVFTYGCNFRCPFCHNAALVTAPAGGGIAEDEVFAYLTERKKLLDGVCVSGGEPTLQPDLAAFIRKVKGLGLKVKLDTNGSRPDVLQSLLYERLVDYVAMDVKSGVSGYARATGTDDALETVRKSIALLIEGSVDYEFRTTLVYELHAERDMYELGELICGANLCTLQRFEDTGGCIQSGLHPLSKETAERYKDIVQPYVKTVRLRNY